LEGKKTYLIRCGEVALKRTNKPYFERMLVERLRFVTKSHKGIDIRREDGLIVVRAPEALDEKTLIKEMSRVFGVDTISPAIECPSDMDELEAASIAFMRQRIETDGVKTFKVDAKRSDKTFPVTSPAIASRIGEVVLDAFPELSVDIHTPERILYLHVRRERSFLFDEKIAAFGGLPLGTNGKGMVLLSGGIDSPVAAFLMAKRGMLLEAVHFHSYPYTSERALEKVKDLAFLLSAYCGKFKIHSINLLPVQEAIAANCPEDEMTILVRRFMMRIAEIIALETDCMMLITGENLGQVASQTAEALVVTDHVVSMPVMRPLIAMDKVEIIEKAQEIGTFETSILPHEDCCTVFLPRHPKTRPRISEILESEKKLDIDALTTIALESRKVFVSTSTSR
jgi:thiamine biosynthesis protein ThiI